MRSSPTNHVALRTVLNYTTSARCFAKSLSAGFLGLGRPTALTLLSLRLELSKILRPALRDLPPTLPSKLDGGGIFLACQFSSEFR